MQNAIVIAASASAVLEPAPIPPADIVAGTPVARSKLLATSSDRSACVMIWECTEGLFDWHYDEDETVVIIDGEVLIREHDGRERRLSQGDMGFFPAGSSCRWHVTTKVRKIAVLQAVLPAPVGFGMRIWRRLLRIMYSSGRAAPLAPVAHKPKRA